MKLDALRLTVERAIAPLRVTAREVLADRAGVAVPVNPARLVQRAAAAVVGAASLPTDLGDAAVALATAGIHAPGLPAATMGALYVGLPHAHSHPPSLVPPAGPVPLPSVGAVVLGGCPRVLIRGVPAVRAGDLGLAPTCGGLAPVFEVVTGSSKVFIGGARAARVGDVCRCCMPALGHSAAGAEHGALAAVAAVALVAGAAADASDAITADEAPVAAALMLSAGMAGAQAAADAVAMAARAAQGHDPALGASYGALATGTSTVLIGGLPMPNLASALGEVANKLRARRAGPRTDGATQRRGRAGHPDC